MVRLEGNGLSHGQRALSRGAGHTKVRYPALVFAAHRREDGDASDVIIDIRSIQSYIACTVSKTLGILVESTMSEVTVLSLLEQSVKVNKLFREVLLEIQGVIFLVDLMELPFREFDLILEMDWLVKHRVSLDCATKRMVLRTVEDGKVVVIRERQNYLLNVISALRAERLLRKGYEALPPNCEVEFGIELLPGTSPVSITLYRMAPKELGELKAQI
ncbi:uncharacterized protein [Gossypium hirsutum]|uniref:Uncharacterized protein n=1 Tax=Gossypium hirsutum TaxID=3635 RepID=A0A1U8NJ25_GOSHI|nr:uncharacterized protein LOC107948033 [Gossypium hirsutum]